MTNDIIEGGRGSKVNEKWLWKGGIKNKEKLVTSFIDAPTGKHLQKCMSSILPCFDFALLFLRLHWVAKREWNAHWMSKKPTESLERYEKNYKSPQDIEILSLFCDRKFHSKWVFVGSFLYVTIGCYLALKPRTSTFLLLCNWAMEITTFCWSALLLKPITPHMIFMTWILFINFVLITWINLINLW